MTTLNMNNPKYFEPFLKTLEDNTARNYHTENALLLATNFGTDQQKTDMKFISDLYKKDGYLTHQNSLAIYYIVKDILKNVKNYLKFYGVNKIHRTLARKMSSKL